MLTTDRNTPRRTGDEVHDPVAADTRIFAGALVALDAAGNAVPGSEADDLTARGRADAHVDNTGGAAGDKHVRVRRGVFRWNNHAADEIDRTHIGGTAYIVDDETVAATDNTGARSPAGEIVEVDDDGVWVETG